MSIPLKMVDVSSVEVENLCLFESLCNKIARLVYSRTDGDKKVLNQILDSLNTIDYNSFRSKKERGVLLINQCCYLIPPEEVSLSLKAANLFINLITKGHIRVEGKTLSLSVDWCLQCLKHESQVVILKCLQALLKGNGEKIEEHSNSILAETKRLSNDFTFTTGSEELCLNCLRCIEALSYLPGPSVGVSQNIVQLYEIFRDVLLIGKDNVIHNEILLCKWLITAMRGICNLINGSDTIISCYLGEVLGIIKGYMLYGILEHGSYKVQKLLPTSNTVPEVLKSSLQSVKKLRGKYDRRSKKVTVTSLNSVEELEDTGNQYMEYSEYNLQTDLQAICRLQTSDSDFSDNEHSQNIKVKAYESKVRHCALILLGTIVEKTSPKVFVAFLPSFLPDGPQLPHMRTLITCLLEDESPKCRSEVVRVLLIIISSSRQYFLQADGLSKSSFTTFSCTISNILKEVHKCLLLTLRNEKNVITLKHILKCISDLICCTPYHKVDVKLLIDIANNVKPFLEHFDIHVQIFALTVFGCIISFEPKCEEITSIIIHATDTSNTVSTENFKLQTKTAKKTNSDADIYDFDMYEEDEPNVIVDMPWLLERCLHNLTDKRGHYEANITLQIESLQVIGALSRNFFKETVINFPNEIINLLKYCSTKPEYSIRLYSGKLMETVLNSLQYGHCSEDESRRASVSLSTHIWESLLPGAITALILNQEEPMLRCTGCDCLANIGVQTQTGSSNSVRNSLIFDQLPRDKQIVFLTLLFSCTRDESAAVRSSAARALAIFVMFPCLREDSLFLLDVVDATLRATKDEQNTVRTQASWLYGNLSEAIVTNKEKGIDDGVTFDIIRDLLQTGIKLTESGPKVKPGAVRGLGNLIKMIDDHFLKKYKELVVESLDTLTKNATTGTFMKARWNSCYAIANVLQNPVIHSNNEWMSKIFSVMTTLVQHYKNFKVRISAGLVLAVPPTRSSYGAFYNGIWSAALNALENSKNISDFNEYQHRDQLVDQICLVLCHLVSLLDLTDLIPLQDILYFHLDNLNYFMPKFHGRIVPEKSNISLLATERIQFLLDEKGLTVEEKSLLRILLNLFTFDSLIKA